VPQVVGLHHVQLAMPPALLVDDLAGLRARPVEAGLPAADDTQLEGFTRFYAEDPFGIRLEFLQVSMIERRFKTGDRARWQLDRSRSERLRSAAMRRATAVTLAVVAAVLVAAPAPGRSAVLRKAGHHRGVPRGEFLDGTPGADVIVALGGSDQVDGGEEGPTWSSAPRAPTS